MSLHATGKAHPEKREQCAGVLASVLENYEKNDEGLNGFIVFDLVRLNAVEHIGIIEKAFKADRVDEMIMGDFEDVQVELGLLKGRITKPARPRFSEESNVRDEFNETEKKANRDKKKEKNKRKQEKKSRKTNRKGKSRQFDGQGNCPIGRRHPFYNWFSPFRPVGMGKFWRDISWMTWSNSTSSFGRRQHSTPIFPQCTQASRAKRGKS